MREFSIVQSTLPKLGVVAETFLLKALEDVLYQRWKLSLTALVFVETSTQTYSLSEKSFGYNYGRLKVQRATRLMKILAKMWKNSEMTSPFAATSMGAAYWVRRTSLCCVCLLMARIS